MLKPEVARVKAGRLDRDEGLGHEALVLLEGAQGGLLAGSVAVEGEDDLAAHLVVIHEQAAQDLDVIGAE